MSGAQSFTIAGGGLTVEVLDTGASLRRVLLDGIDHSLTLGLADLAHYPAHSPHLGAIAGRVGNRIAGGQFELDGRTITTDRNLDGRHTLHGGTAGFGRRRWTVSDLHTDAITLSLVSPNGEAGFPGALAASCTYACEDDGRLSITLGASTNALTVVNLAPHAYFNLDGTATINAHQLHIDAQRWTPVDADLIPTGEVRAVDEAGQGEIDFRTLRTIGNTAHDQNYCLGDERSDEPRLAARLCAGGIALELHTTEPGLQLYTGDNLRQGVPGLAGRIDTPRAGVCLESQCWPDAVHHRHFPSIELAPGDRYRHVTVYHFSRDRA